MKYLNTSAVKSKIHKAKKQITPDGLNMIDVKMDAFLNKLTEVHNGGRKKIDGVLVALIRI